MSVRYISRIRGGYQCLRCGHITTTRRAAENHITRWSPACGQPLADGCVRCGRQLADHADFGHRFTSPTAPATRKCAAWIGCGNLTVPTADLSFRGFCPACEAVATGAVTQTSLF